MEKINQIGMDFISSKDFANALNVSRRTLHRWGRLGKGPHRIKVGRSVYYRRAAIEKWLATLEHDNNVDGRSAREIQKRGIVKAVTRSGGPRS